MNLRHYLFFTKLEKESSMRYFCFGNSFELLTKKHSNKFFGKLIFKRLAVTEDKLIDAFIQTKDFIFCSTIADAKKLRIAKINIDNSHATAETRDYPAKDYAIYEVEITESINDQFTPLTSKTSKQLKPIISFNLWFGAEYLHDRSAIPNINVFSAKNSDLTMSLVSCYYFSPIDNHEEIAFEPKLKQFFST